MVIVITGPIASGKSTLARAVARESEQRGATAAAVDLDLVYEMLDSSGAPKNDEAVWRRARGLSARLAESMFQEGIDVVILEGDYGSPTARSDFIDALDRDTDVRFVTLRVCLATALKRVQADPSRVLSRDPNFLRKHYRTTAADLEGPAMAGLVVDTEAMTVEEAAGAVTDWALQG